MAMQYDKLSNFIQTIMEDVAKESQEIIAKSDEAHQQKLTEASDRCLAESYTLIKERLAAIQKQSGQMISQKVLDNNREIFRMRKQIKKEIMDVLLLRLQKYTGTAAYAQTLKAAAASVCDTLNCEQVAFFVRTQDMHLAPLLKEVKPGCIAVESCADIAIGGLIGCTQDRKRRIDASYDAALTDIDTRFFELCPFISENTTAEDAATE